MSWSDKENNVVVCFNISLLLLFVLQPEGGDAAQAEANGPPFTKELFHALTPSFYPFTIIIILLFVLQPEGGHDGSSGGERSSSCTL